MPHPLDDSGCGHTREECFLKLHTIVSDMDGTLLTPDHRLDAQTEQALKRVQDLGVRVVLASGRSAASMRPYVEQLGALHPYIASNGAQVLASDGSVIWEQTIDVPVLHAVIRWLKEQGIYMQIYYGDHYYYDVNCQHAENYRISSGTRGCFVPDLLTFVTAPSVKILGVTQPEDIPRLMREVNARFGEGILAATSNPEFLELSHPSVGKGPALAALAARLGFDAAGTMAVGDSINDLSMLEWAGMPVAVGNAREEVKRMAWRVIGDGPTGGVAQMLETLIAEGVEP